MYDACDFNLMKTIILVNYILIKKRRGNFRLNYLESLFLAQPHADIKKVTMLNKYM